MALGLALGYAPLSEPVTIFKDSNGLALNNDLS